MGGRCPLCDYPIEDEPVTAEDTTPYAQSEQPGRREWWVMTEWIWTAGAGRLSHLSLMRASPPARRYAGKSLNLIALVGAICWLSLTGWHEVTLQSVDEGGQPSEPAGRAWCELVTTPAETPIPSANPSRVIAWWWNPLLASSGAVAALVWAFILSRLLLSILRRGVERSLPERYRGQERLSAALCYSTAWATPLIPAGLVLALLPLCRLAEVGDWPIKPPAVFVYVPAAVVAGFGAFMVWFGLIRLAMTVPVRARTRVVVFCGLGMPLIAAVLILGSIWGLGRLQTDLLSYWLQVQW